MNKLLITCLLALFATFGVAQVDYVAVLEPDSAETPETQEDETPIFKPWIGFTTGTITYYGDFSKGFRTNTPMFSRTAFGITATQRLNNYLDFNFHLVYGKVGANEYSLNRNLNFESTLFLGGANITYNFDHLIKNKSRVFEPYVGIGIEAIEFLSKTDLYDANGALYHYWTDGTIRNLPETPENRSIAVRLQRDYVYETDIREQNADGFGPYAENTFAVPVYAGVNLKVTDRFNMRFNASYHYTFTDLIDGVTKNSLGNRAGDASNDAFLFTSFTFSYDLFRSSKTPLQRELKKLYKDVDLLALEEGDKDLDGVTDLLDSCAHTPSGVAVDELGCPLDADQDGIPDYLDKEPNTAAGAPVDDEGRYLTDELIEQRYLAYIDSTGMFAKQYRRVHSSDKGRRRVRTSRYMVGVSTEGLTEEQANKLLSLPGAKPKSVGGNQVVTVGEFEDPRQAMSETGKFTQMGFNEPQIIKQTGDGNLVRVFENGVESSSTVAAQFPDGKVYRLQVGAFKNKANINKFRDVKGLIAITYADGITRYYSESYTNFKDAAKARIDLLNKHPEAFIVAFENGERLAFSRTGGTIRQEYVDQVLDKNAAINKNDVKFRVQLGAYGKEIPTEVVEQFLELGKIKQVKDGELVKYYSQPFSSYNEASDFKQRAAELGIKDAFIVGELKGEVIKATEALNLLK